LMQMRRDCLLHKCRAATFPYFCAAVDLLTCGSCAAAFSGTRSISRSSANRNNRNN
jgi:hypothetical protein